MKQLKEFYITGLTLSGFKCYDQTVEFAFGNPTIVTGGNGQGKSSIAEGVSYRAFYSNGSQFPHTAKPRTTVEEIAIPSLVNNF